MRNPRAPKRRMLRACVRACSLACVGRVPHRTHLGVGNEVAVRHASVDRALAPAVQHCAVEESYTVATAQQCNARECSGATMQRSGMRRRNDATLGSAPMHSLMPRHGAARRGRLCGSSSTCSPGADVGGESPVPVQMWQGWARSLGVDMSRVSPVTARMWPR